MDTVGKRIAFFRHSKGLTQDCLAIDLGIAQSTLSEIENDVKSPSWDLICKTASVLKIPSSLLTPNEGGNIFNNEANDLVNNITNQFGNGFDDERKVWQELLKSKEEVIATKEAFIRLLQGNK